jgi:predicted aldo/keto reductase-like oxidoreductase
VFQEELDACGVEYFDLLLAHAVNSAHYDMYTRQGVFETAKEFVADGRARHFGISYHDGPELLERILTEHPEIEAVQLQINYEDWDSPSVRSREVYDVATAHGIPVIVMEPCKGGQLVNLPEAAQAALDAAPNPEELSNAGFALRFCATQPNVAMVLSGMNNMDQVEDNLHAMAGDPAPLTAEQLQPRRPCATVRLRSPSPRSLCAAARPQSRGAR